MEICGGQTHTLIKFGIDQMLPGEVTLVHGPGCPVCVTPIELIDRAMAIAGRPGVIFSSFGDMLRVPGTNGDLLGAKARGADVRIVYSPLDAVALASKNPDRQVVFFAVGFETTAPANAMAVWQAQAARPRELLDPLLARPRPARDGGDPLLAREPRAGVPRRRPRLHRHGVPRVRADRREVPDPHRRHRLRAARSPAGDLHDLSALEEGRWGVENQYARSVVPRREPDREETIDRVFEVCDRQWRGIGPIPMSGHRLRPELASFDAAKRFDVETVTATESPLCIAGEILQGRRKPRECSAFGRECTPEHPLGAPMVSTEGACSAYYQFGRKE